MQMQKILAKGLKKWEKVWEWETFYLWQTRPECQKAFEYILHNQRGAPDTALLSLDAERAIDTNLEFMCTLAWEGVFCKMDLIAL